MNKLLSQEQCYYEIRLGSTQCLNANVASSFLWERWLGLGILAMTHRIARYFHTNFSNYLSSSIRSRRIQVAFDFHVLCHYTASLFLRPSAVSHNVKGFFLDFLHGQVARKMPALVLGCDNSLSTAYMGLGVKMEVAVNPDCFPVVSLWCLWKPPSFLSRSGISCFLELTLEERKGFQSWVRSRTMCGTVWAQNNAWYWLDRGRGGGKRGWHGGRMLAGSAFPLWHAHILFTVFLDTKYQGSRGCLHK